MNSQPKQYTQDDMLHFALTFSPGSSFQSMHSKLIEWEKNQGLVVTWRGDRVRITDNIETDDNGVTTIKVQIPGRV